ncbi:hypothetical protein, partial [Nonomuraea sp. KM90]
MLLLRLSSALCIAAMLALTACSEDPAARAARTHAEQIAERLGRGLSWNSEDIGHALSRDADVDVYSVTGTRYSVSDQGRVLLRIRATSPVDRDGEPLGRTSSPSPAAVAVVCFEISVSYSDTGVAEVDCPAGEPRSFRAPAEIPRTAY